MRKVTLFIAVSLDEYIADRNGGGSGMAPGTDTECPESSFYRKDPVYFGADLLTGKKTSERGRERHLTLRRSRACAAADKRGSAYFRDSLPARRRNPSVRGA